MPFYMKAYPLRELRRFPGWTERTGAVASAPLSDEDVVYLHETFVVTRDASVSAAPLFDEIDDAWRNYCRGTLAFAPPDWQAESRCVQAEVFPSHEDSKS